MAKTETEVAPAKEFVTGSGEPTAETETTVTGEAAIPTTEESRATLLRQAYGAATTALRESYRDEFERLYVAEATKRGVDYKPKPTAEQKAQQEFERLLEQYPHLRESIGQQG